jgi:hypothetical protein
MIKVVRVEYIGLKTLFFWEFRLEQVFFIEEVFERIMVYNEKIGPLVGIMTFGCEHS